MSMQSALLVIVVVVLAAVGYLFWTGKLVLNLTGATTPANTQIAETKTDTVWFGK